MRHGVSQRDAVSIEQPQGERRVATHDVLLAVAFRRQYMADIVYSPGEVVHRPVAEDETEREQCLRRQAIVVVPFLSSLDAPGRALPYPTECGSFSAMRSEKPGLPHSAE